MSGKRALVLAGGGIAGIAWETGVLAGIAEVAPAAAKALVDSDVLVGTSAGSTVAAQLDSGLTLDELFERQVAGESHEIDPGVDFGAIAERFVPAMLAPETSKQEKLQQIGAIAADIDTVGEALRRAVIAHRLPSHRWPDRRLRITAIDTATGELVVFDADSGVELVDAVAASCAVPGVWPPATIGDRRYIDGGVNSVANTSVAWDCASAVVLVPSEPDAPSPWGSSVGEEIAGFPGPALAVFADSAALAAFGSNPLNPDCRVPAAHAGRAQGRREAGRVADFLRTLG